MNNLTSHFDFEKLKKLPKFERAFIIVSVMFNDKTDKEGSKYINHLFNVSSQFKETDEKVVGLLHDLVEDTDATFEELEKAGFEENIIEALKLLTKEHGSDYKLYIDRLLNSNNLLAIKIKEADMKNNMDPERLKKLNLDKQKYFLDKYSEPYSKIKEKIGELENDRYQINKRK